MSQDALLAGVINRKIAQVRNFDSIAPNDPTDS